MSADGFPVSGKRLPEGRVSGHTRLRQSGLLGKEQVTQQIGQFTFQILWKVFGQCALILVTEFPETVLGSDETINASHLMFMEQVGEEVAGGYWVAREGKLRTGL
jgi:hypothetical protein